MAKAGSAKGRAKAKGGMTGKTGRAAPKRPKYVYEVAPDVQRDLEEIVRLLPDDFAHVDARRVVCFRSRGSTARIYARIWSLPGIWQAALGIEAHYVIEVVERYDRQPKEEQEKTLLHELMHIPKTFSGALVPHNCFGKKINCDSEDRLHRKLVAARAPPRAGASAASTTSSARWAPRSRDRAPRAPRGRP